MPSVRVDILGDTNSLQKAYRKAADESKLFGKHVATSTTSVHGLTASAEKGATGLATFAKSALLAGGALVGIGSLYEGIKKTVGAAEDFNQAQRQLQAQVKANGESFQAAAVMVDKLEVSQVQLGFTSTQTEKAFTQLARASGSSAAAYKYMGVTADLAAARHIDLSKAALLVGKVIDGNVGALNRYGVAVPKGTSVTDALRIAQQKLEGQARASVTPFEKFHAVLNNVEVEIGEVLLPTITKYLNKVTDWMSKTENQKKITDTVKTAIHDMGAALKVAKDVIDAAWPIAKKAGDSFQGFADAVGGAKNAVILLGGAFATWKIASTIGNISTAAGGQGGKGGAAAAVKLLAGNLGLLKTVGPIAIAVTIAVALRQTSQFKEFKDWLEGAGKKYGSGFWGGLFAGPEDIFGTAKKALGNISGYANDPMFGPTVAAQNPANVYGPPVPTAPPPGMGGPIGGGGGSKSLAAGKAKMLAFAKSALGTPYVWGGAGPGGFDCSGLVQWAFSNGLNVSLPRTTYQQETTGQLVGTNTLKGAKPGDVIFTQYGEGNKKGPGHEGIYVGGGNVLAAPHTGANVQVTPLSAFTSGGKYTVRDLAPGASLRGLPGSISGETPPPDLWAQQVSDAKAKAKTASEKAAKKVHDAAVKAAEKVIKDVHADAQLALEGTPKLGVDVGKLQKAWTALATTIAKPFQALAGKAANQVGYLQQLMGTTVPRRVTDYTSEITAQVNTQVTALEDGLAKLKARGMGGTAAAAKLASQLNTALTSQEGLLQNAVQAARGVYDTAVSKFTTSFGKLAQDIVSQFQAQTAAHITQLGGKFFQGSKTPKEAALAAMQAADTYSSLQDALNTANASGDRKQIDQAQRAIDEYNLSLEAIEERTKADNAYAAEVKTYTDQRTIQETALTDSLNKFGTGVQNGKLSMDGLPALLKTFGITLGTGPGNATGVVALFSKDLKAATTDNGGIISSLSALQKAFDALVGWVNDKTGSNIYSGAVNVGGGAVEGAAIGLMSVSEGPAAGVAGGAAAYYQPTTYTTPGGTGPYAKKPMLAGGGFINRSGLAYLHKGETVVPANGSGGNTIEIHVHGSLISDERKLTDMVLGGLRREKTRLATLGLT